MPESSQERSDQRRNEIICACEKLYQTRGLQDISMKDISMETSFSRPSIYNYFETKEEIFLALLTREYEDWTRDLQTIMRRQETVTREEFPGLIAKTLERRITMLKISTMNLYAIEEHSRLECLVEFKQMFKRSREAFAGCLEKCRPKCTRQETDRIQNTFFPFMYGIYPYTHPTEKQCMAMKEAGLPYTQISVYELTCQILKQFLQ